MRKVEGDTVTVSLDGGPLRVIKSSETGRILIINGFCWDLLSLRCLQDIHF